MTNESKKNIAKITAIAMISGIGIYEGINTDEIEIKEPYQKVLESFEDDTKLDEAINNNIATYKGKSIVEAADTLEEAIKISEILKAYDFSEAKKINKLSEKEIAFSKNLSREDIILLTEVVNSKKDTEEIKDQKQKAIKILDYVKTEKEKYIEDNGKKIVVKTLWYTIKSSVAESLGLDETEINEIKIPKLKKVQDMNFYIIYNNKHYFVSSKSELFDSLYYMYQVKTTNNFEGQEKEIYLKALNNAKKLTMTGVKDKNQRLMNNKKIKESKKLLKKQ